MAALATVADVEARLRTADRHLATDDPPYTEGLLDEASALVIGHLGCDPTVTDDSTDPPTTTVPDAVVVVTSRMVARVLMQGAASAGGSAPVGAEQMTRSMGPFSETYGFGPSGASSGSPWLTSADKEALKPYACDGKAFTVDTAPRGLCHHSAVCSANSYINVPSWQAYCTCGADIAGEPIYGSMP